MIYSFSTKPSDTEAKFEVDLLRARCEKEGWNFSAMILKLIKEYNGQERTKD